MTNVKLKIPQIGDQNDLTIIYKEKQEIDIDGDNYKSLLELSKKYQFHELESSIIRSQQSIPDNDSIIKDVIDSFSENQFDTSKEEIIARNLDSCIKNGYLSNFPIQILIRMLNSPN